MLCIFLTATSMKRKKKKEESSVFYPAKCTIYTRVENAGMESEMSTIMIFNGKQVILRSCDEGIPQLYHMT